jgi:hypothetical protein
MKKGTDILVGAVKSIEGMDKYVLKNWKGIILQALTEIRLLVRYANQTHVGMATPEAKSLVLSPAEQLDKFFYVYGLCAGGGWAHGPMEGDSKRAVYIHWPRFLGALAMMPVSPYHKLWGLPLLGWGFAKLYRRKNLVFYELLRRKLHEALIRGGSFDKPPADTQPLDDDEHPLYAASAVAELQPDGELTATMRRAFANTFGDASPYYGPTTRPSHLRFLAPEIRQAVSTLYCETLFTYLKYILQTSPLPYTSVKASNGFAPEYKSEYVKEMYFMHQAGGEDKPFFGCKKSMHLVPETRTVLVDIAEFAEYRTRTGSTFYTSQRKRLGFENETWRQVATELVFDFQRKYPTLVPPERNYAQFEPMIRAVFSPETIIDHVLFVPMDVFGDVRKRYAKVEPMLNSEHVRVPPRKVVPKKAIICSDPIADVGGATFTFKILFYRKTVYFHPPWTVPMNKVLAPAYSRQNYLPGVFRDPETLQFYFTFDFLTNDPNSPVERYPSLRTFLEPYNRITREYFDEVRERGRRKYIDHDNRNTGKYLRYTKQEDQAILKYYKPGMTPLDRESLRSECEGRTWTTIQRRAKVLRDNMLKDGCVDISLLPTRNYSADINKKIAANKQKMKEESREP